MTKNDSAASTPHSSESRPAKKRKLRPPGEAFTTKAGPADNPALHSGRSRAIPHVDGQWSTHIYLEPLASKALGKTLEDAISQARAAFQSINGPTLHSMLEEDHKRLQSLHLSLSRPIQLWTGQRGAFISACRAAVAALTSFEFSFASFDILTNDERTRSFLVCEVGFGHDQLASLTGIYNEVLEKGHLPKYYAEPRFHISIAWWLHDDEKMLSQEALKALNDSLGEDLRKPILEIGHINLKIGKEVTVIELL